MYKVVTVREEKVINIDDAHGVVTMRQIDFSQLSELGFLIVCSFSNSIKPN